MTVDVSQIRKLAADLDRAANRLGKDSSDVVRKTAKAVERAAKSRVEVKTGATRDSITTTIKGSGNAKAIYANIGPSTLQGRLLEYGTARQSPRPYLGPALDAQSEGFNSAMETLASKVLD